ncbi:TraB/GumN family protein [Pseudoxanthomonas wuyuanensis]
MAQAGDIPHAQADGRAIVDMDTVVVSGVQPGPGLWKVSKGEHVLWVMGTLSPLPRKMTWLSSQTDAILADAQEVVRSPGVSFDADIGIVRGALLIPSLLKARKNPDGAMLKDVLPADLYARWSVLKARYLGRDAGVEKWRPMFAARELYEAALKKSGLSESGVVGPVVDKAAKRHGIKTTSPTVKFKVEQPKAAIREFQRTSLDDLECFRKTLDRIENDLPSMVERANAWSVGDVEALRALPYENQQMACISAFSGAEFARKRGLVDLPAKVRNQWLSAAETALETNRVSFATLPIAELLRPDGHLSQLQAKGYQIEAP